MNILLHAAFAGAATGSRSQSALAAYELTDPHPRTFRRAATVLGAAGELVGDKLPRVPSRLQPAALGARLVCGGLSGWLLAGRHGGARIPATLVGCGAAAATSFAGARTRGLLATRLGNDLPGALAEDAIAVSLAGLAVRRG